MTHPVSDEMRDTVWRSIWDGETLNRYYRTLNRRYQRLDMVVNWLLAAAGVGTVAVAVSPAPPLTLILVASSVTTLTIWGMLEAEVATSMEEQ